MTVRAHILKEIIARTDAMDVSANAKAQFKRMVWQLGSSYGICSMARGERVDYARQLLDHRVSRTTISSRLIKLFSVSKSQAYADIAEALKNCPESEP